MAAAFLGATAFMRITNGPIDTDLGGNNRSCAWGDYDNDADPDLLVVDWISTPTNRLFRSNGSGIYRLNPALGQFL